MHQENVETEGTWRGRQMGPENLEKLTPLPAMSYFKCTGVDSKGEFKISHCFLKSHIWFYICFFHSKQGTHMPSCSM